MTTFSSTGEAPVDLITMTSPKGPVVVIRQGEQMVSLDPEQALRLFNQGLSWLSE